MNDNIVNIGKKTAEKYAWAVMLKFLDHDIVVIQAAEDYIHVQEKLKRVFENLGVKETRRQSYEYSSGDRILTASRIELSRSSMKMLLKRKLL